MKHLAIALIITLLTACGGGNGQAGRPAAPVPTGPAKPQVIQPLPTAPPDTLIFENIPLQTYFHPAGQFSIDYPDNWQIFEQTDGVVFVDPNVQAGYSVQVSRVEAELPPQALNRFATQFVQANFGQEDGFKILTGEGGQIRFKTVDANFGPSINEASLTRQGQTVFITLLTVAEDKWDASEKALRELTDSLEIHAPQTVSPVATPTPAGPPLWELYAHPAQNFAFLVPNNWVITDTEQSVQAAWPEQGAIFAVEVIPSPGAGEKPDAVETFAQKQADALAAQFDDLEMLPLSDYQVGQATGYTFDYLYTNAGGAQIAGSIIAVGIRDNIYRVSISAPAPVYKAALEWFNPMMQSFQILKGE